MRAFKAYDIRGVWGSDLNEETAYRIGYFLPDILKADTFLVGRDMRLSSDTVFARLTKGLNDRGADVDSIGLSTTPLIYWATARFGYEASVMITASHNPSNHNGFKISGKDAKPIGYDTGLNDLEKLVESDAGTPVAKRRGITKEINIHRQYLDFQRQFIDDFTDLRIGIDCSNGASCLFIKELLGDTPHYINDVLDGSFPGHEPNPLEAVNQVQIKETVLENRCDIGLLFDGDADRITFIDERGHFISPDLIIAFLGHYFFGEKNQKGIVLQDIRSSRAIQEHLGALYGTEVETWRVGRAYAALRLRELDGCFGGELAGHYYFRDFYYSDSGIMAALLVLRLLARFKSEGKTMSQIINEISSYQNSGEINFTIERKQEAMDAVRDHFMGSEKPARFLDFDGYRLDYQDWWLNIRPSNTEPYLRFLAEAKSKEKLQNIIGEVTEIVSRYR
ncbi:MAG: phosphomannomutase/phosphoglucomutase [Bacteroidales bacterium]|nr:phosphomannomutase/phosphoglucomutase [Bacteroidales bacterium]